MSEQLVVIIIVLVLTIAVTTEYVVAVGRNRRSVIARTWELLKKVADILWGMG